MPPYQGRTHQPRKPCEAPTACGGTSSAPHSPTIICVQRVRVAAFRILAERTVERPLASTNPAGGPHLWTVQEEAYHENGGPLQPGHAARGHGDHRQHGCDADAVDEHDLQRG